MHHLHHITPTLQFRNMSSYYCSKAPMPLAAAAAVVCFKELVGDRASTCRPEVKTGRGSIQRGPIGCPAYTCGAGSLSTTANPFATGNATCCCSARLQQLHQEEGASRAAVNEVAGGGGGGSWGAGQEGLLPFSAGTASAGGVGTGITDDCCSPPRRTGPNKIIAVPDPAAPCGPVQGRTPFTV